MADQITPREKDFSQWYQDVVIQSRLADYSPVKGCMVIRPNGYAIWERIQRQLDDEIKKTKTKNAYFPLFIPESFLQKEAEHVEGFAPECAVVTHAGGKKLEEPYVVRPTSETIINSMFAKWIQSYRDLPMKINQWANVVRWEMRTRLFLRTTEFLWQEGHTCHKNGEESEAFTIEMLKVYQKFAEEVLAIPVIAGLKTESEKFAGALRTYCIEAMMQDKKALQAGTSHNLSTHFAEAFETKYLDHDGQEKFVHQTSWGVSTRLIGGLVMTHSDDRGLVLPPRVAGLHVVVVPVFGKATKDLELKKRLLEKSQQLVDAIKEECKKLDYSIEIELDADENKKPGWKFHEYEMIGVPIRIELGPRDLDQDHVIATRRDLSEKQTIKMDKLPRWVCSQLVQMQKDLLEKARKFREDHTHQASSFEEFEGLMKDQGGFVEVPWSLDAESEKKIKERFKATPRCILLDEANKPIRVQQPCFTTGKILPEGNVKVIFSKSY
ncbi:MAG: proline--tRNA ligase [Bdellovibrionaceae bacterium]|nr:proline--tRNA ligase [Pseudobdellovibrionaceae bacterium]